MSDQRVPQDPDATEAAPPEDAERTRDPAEGLMSMAADDLPTVVAVPPKPMREGPGEVIGRYTLLQQIGEGGMGEVWMAEQSEPVARRVALKIIKAGMDTKQVVARFEAERQALAMMDHPNIAHVFDGGATESGRPFFVMELVEGIPITEYCNQFRLGTRARLELFRQVCEAIAHAHQKGIIHRDIKPSNILVTGQNGNALPKVIDFGVAKATAQRLTEMTYCTEYGQMIGTPAYMSPEQALITEEDIDTRSDVYSLGVLLYELLTGSTPFEDQQLRQAGLDEMCRFIREVDPPKPSTKLSALGERVAMVAALHRTTSKGLGRTIRGDLDWIVMRALEKDRDRRYASVGSFGDDVGRYLRSEPVEAGPPTRSYRLKKLIRRHKVEFGAVAAVSVVLLLAAVFSTAMALSERSERKRAVASLKVARQSVREMLLEVGDRGLANTAEMDLVRKKLIERALNMNQRLLELDRGDLELQVERASTHNALGHIYEVLGEGEDAVREYEGGIALLRALRAGSPEPRGKVSEDDGRYYTDDLARLRHNHGTVLLGGREYGRAEEALGESIKLWERAIGQAVKPRRWLIGRARTLGNLGILHDSRGQLPEAERTMRAAIESLERAGPEVRSGDRALHSLGGFHSSLGLILAKRGNLDEARKSYLEARRILSKLVDDHPRDRTYRAALATALQNLALSYDGTTQLDKYTQYTREALEQYEELGGRFPDAVDYRRSAGLAALNLGVSYLMPGDDKKASELFDLAVKAFGKLHAEFPENTEYQRLYGSALHNLAVAISVNGTALDRLGEAMEIYERVRPIQEGLRKKFQRDPKIRVELSNTYFNMGLVWAQMPPDSAPPDQLERAIKWFEKAVGECEYLVQELTQDRDHEWELGGMLWQLGRTLAVAGRNDEARRNLERAVELIEGARGRSGGGQLPNKRAEMYYAFAKADLGALLTGKKPSTPGLPTHEERLQVLENIGVWDKILETYKKNKESSDE